ncbi:MAG: phosphoglucosamine mutase [Elusimicrobiales bacterium]
MPKYFGTDGIRGIPFKFPLEPGFIKKIGYAVSKKLKNSAKTVFIARDTRKSGTKIIDYLSSGINSAGLKVFDLGIITTPSLSYILSKNKVSFGIMVSASHNPPEFNGIKVLNSKGEKISEKTEEEIEKLIDLCDEIKTAKKISNKKDMSFVYCDYVVSAFKGEIKDIDAVLDCSNGSAYKIAPYIFKNLNLKFHLIGSKPNGNNINIGCGALDTELMVKNVLKFKAFCGVSYDGDSDRCMISDENGDIVDGDDIIAFLSVYYKKNKILKNNCVVLTHMSNYGLLRFLKENKVKVISVDVGDRNVSHAMDKYGSVLGGEPSGHIIIKKYLPTGDGIITSLEFLKAVTKTGIKVGDVKKMWKRFPSHLKSYSVKSRPDMKKLDGFLKEVKNMEEKINGRIFVRYSGTEPVLRVLIEADKERRELEEISLKIFDIYNNAAKKLNILI